MNSLIPHAAERRRWPLAHGRLWGPALLWLVAGIAAAERVPFPMDWSTLDQCAIGLERFLDPPAGRHGFLRRVGALTTRRISLNAQLLQARQFVAPGLLLVAQVFKHGYFISTISTVMAPPGVLMNLR